MRRLACCSRHKEISVDFDEHYERVVTYDGLESIESRMFSGNSYDKESSSSVSSSRGNGWPTNSMDEDDSSCSSSKDACGSSSSEWFMNKQDNLDEWESNCKSTPRRFSSEENDGASVSDVECMKERFAKLLLGEDVSGGCRGLPSAVALSNAITNLAASVFGELWKLEPLPEERKFKWLREMDWLLSPAKYMVELVPAKQNGSNGRILDVMTPKLRSDIHINLPALKKLDSMLIETLDSMVGTEFWYAEGRSRAQGRSSRQCKKWWLPSPRIPKGGLSVAQRKKLELRGKMVHQVLKAAKSINQQVLHEMPAPCLIKDALPKSVRANLGEYLYRAVCLEPSPVEELFSSLDFKSEHATLDTANRLETAVFVWKLRISERASGKSPARHSWTFVKDTELEVDKMDRAQLLLRLLKIRFPNLPHTFLDVTKVQYNKDAGHAILEAYSRVLASLAFRILSRIGDILLEDDSLKKNAPPSFPNSKSECYSNLYLPGIAEDEILSRMRHSLMDQLKSEDGKFCHRSASQSHNGQLPDNEKRRSQGLTTPFGKIRECYGGNGTPLRSP